MSLNGRVLVVKALALSKFQYIASLVAILDHIVSLVNKIVYEFVWNGKTDKVKRKSFEKEYNKGEYKMINLEDLITATSITINNTEIKITQFADDTCLYLNGTNSLENEVKVFEDFYRYAGLRLNIEKTEAIWLGKTNKQIWKNMQHQDQQDQVICYRICKSPVPHLKLTSQ